MEDIAAANARLPRHVTLGEVLRLSLRASPEILRIDAALAEKLAHATDVQLPPNPELSAEYFPQEEELRRLGAPNEYDFELSQQFRLSHFGMRQAYASALKETADLESQADLLRVLNDTTLLYYRYWILSQREQMLDDGQRQAAEIIKRVSAAVARADAPSTEGNLFRAEAIRFSTELEATRAERKEAQTELLRAMGLPWQELRVAAPILKRVPAETFRLLQFAQSRANLRTLVLARLRAANRRADVAAMDMFPELTARVLYSVTTDWNEPEFGGGFSVRIPLWDWNQAERQRADAQRALSAAEANAVDRLTFDRIVEMRQRSAISTQRRAEAYWNDVIPAYRKAYELSHRMFDEGQATMLQLWQVQRQIFDATETALRDTAQALAARTVLEQTLGGRIEEIPDSAAPKQTQVPQSPK